MKKASCVSIDLINADKPPASLAFMAGACEIANYEYQCISLNATFLTSLDRENLDKIYNNLVKAGSAEKILDILQPLLNNIAESIKNYNPDTILISVFSFMQHALALEFLKILKEKLPSTEIISGGPGISNSYQDQKTFGSYLLDQNLIDYYCLGEGDQVLLEYLKGNKIQLGLTGKNNKFESWVPQIDELDDVYLMPSYKKIRGDIYHSLESKDSTVYSISTSRGCVRSCSFCDVAHLWKKFKFRSGKHIAKEILKHHREVGAVHFTIVDSLINGSLKSFKDFNSEMIELKNTYPSLEKFSYNGMFIVRDKKTHNEELFKIMRDAGCESLAIGVETGSDRLRVEMNKKFTNEDLDFHLEMSSKYGIRNSLFMFVAYPTETREDFEQSLRMLEKYQKYLINDTIIGINHAGVFSILENTPVYDQRNEIGLVMDHHRDTFMAKKSWHNTNNPELTMKERASRDIEFRQKAIDLRYPVPYAHRYIQYLKDIDKDSVLVSD